MKEVKMAGEMEGGVSQLSSGRARTIIRAVGVVFLICLFAYAPALGITTVKTSLDFTGDINGYPAEYSGVMIMNVASSHCACSLYFARDFHAQTGTVKHLTKQTRGNRLIDTGSDLYDLTLLTGGTYNLTTMWIESDGDTLVLVQDVSSIESEDTMFITSIGVWNGTCDIIPDDATVSIDPIHELWHQVEPGHMQGSYWQYGIINGLPDTLQVVKDYTYAGAEILPFDEILTISNYEVYFDEGTQIEYSQYDLSLSKRGSVPSLSQWGMVIVVIFLLAAGILFLFRRQKAQMHAA